MTYNHTTYKDIERKFRERFAPYIAKNCLDKANNEFLVKDINSNDGDGDTYEPFTLGEVEPFLKAQINNLIDEMIGEIKKWKKVNDDNDAWESISQELLELLQDYKKKFNE